MDFRPKARLAAARLVIWGLSEAKNLEPRTTFTPLNGFDAGCMPPGFRFVLRTPRNDDAD